MATTSIRPAMSGEKNLFSFFDRSQARPPQPVQPDAPQSNTLPQFDGNDDNALQSIEGPKEVTLKRSDQKVQKTLQEIYNPGVTLPGKTRPEQAIDPSETEEEHMRRKRRRLTPTESVEVGGTSASEENEVRRSPRNAKRHALEGQLALDNGDGDGLLEPLSQESGCLAATEDTEKQMPPKKMLKLNASGKLGSPVSKKPKVENQPAPPKRRGRPRKGLLVKLVYSIEGTIGNKIDDILAGKQRIELSAVIAPVAKQTTPRKARPRKPTHPFFLSQQPDEVAPKAEAPRKVSAITPGKLRRQNMEDRFDMGNEPVDSYTSTLLKDRLIARQPGAKDPAWPAQGHAHLHGFDARELNKLHWLSRESHFSLNKKKQKAARRPFPKEESILTRFTEQLSPENEGQLRSDGFRDPHPALCLPKRSLLSGSELVARLQPQLSSNLLPDVNLEGRSSQQGHVQHPAVQRLLKLIPTTLGAFDQGRGETASWTQKYAPTAADQVLQPPREMSILKDWLAALRVSAVENSSKVDHGIAAKAQMKLKKKRRSRDDDMDDFLVDDGEDLHKMDEITEPEDTDLNPGGRKVHSIVHSHSSDAKLTNLMLLSGPHGCGKSAAAYAVAKELGFKVFEVHSSERRSGKDVFDKVGDMSENHLMKHHGVESAEVSAAEEPTRNEEAFQRDLASGRQGKMNAFFKPKAIPKSSPSSPKKIHKARVMESVQQALKKPSKDQQQSLILLEEVDILFKDDKDFWTSVLRLIATSKRPFIMTCNDEDLIPLQLMKLHAILRFSLPPTRVTTDYLLTIAAAEGHLLQRHAVESLYESKAQDLRASISELNFWCQMGVGDPRNGLSWMGPQSPRNPHSYDPEQRIRVVSEQTFQNGMGIVPESTLNEESQLCWAFQEFGIEPVDAIAHCHSDSHPTALKDFSHLAYALSAIDVFSSSHGEPELDATQKPMSEKARGHYIEGLTVLQTDEYPNFSPLSTELNATSTLTAYQAFSSPPIENIQSRLGKIITSAEYISKHYPAPLTRHAFTCFDAIATPTDNTSSTAFGAISQSVFDGPLAPITLDVAPYVRSILHHEIALNEHREQLNTIMLGPNASSKQGRKTRAARSALEGSQRSDTRRERWFVKTLDVVGVMATGGESWPREVVGVRGDIDMEGVVSSQEGGGNMPLSSAETL